MKRNWYAAMMLALLVLMVSCAGLYMDAISERLRQDVQNAFSCALNGDYDGARRGFATLGAKMEENGLWLRLVVRRTLVDKVEETVATLPHYAQPENQADLAVEAARCCALLDQMEGSFFGGG